MKPLVTVVGSINADLVVTVQRHPKPGETLLGSGGMFYPGGKGANQAVAAALRAGAAGTGVRVRLIGAVGRDPWAEAATRLLGPSGVLTCGTVHTVGEDSVTDAKTPTGLAVIEVADSGENSIVVVPGANAHVTAEVVAKNADVLRQSDVILLQGEIPADGFAAAIHAAGPDTRIVINLAPVIEVEEAALKKADPLIANEHEAGLILTSLGGTVVERDTSESIAAKLIDLGFRSVVVTLGSKGALVAKGHGTPAVQIASPKVTAVDTTGAGDAFAGALVAELASGTDLLAAAKIAVRVGAYAVTGKGAQTSYPGPGDRLPE